jgi:hypothetical protein
VRTKKAPVLTPSEPIKQSVGFGAAEAAVRDRRIELHRRVSDADVPDRVTEFAWFGGRAQTQRFVLREPSGFDHVIGTHLR